MYKKSISLNLGISEMLRLFGKTLVLILALWGVLLGICAVLGIQIYFPFSIAEEDQIPYFRMQSVRVAVFMTFAYYAAVYLTNATKEVYPIHFLKIFMLSLGITGCIFTHQADAGFSNYIVALFFFLCGITFHILSKPNIRKYFS